MESTAYPTMPCNEPMYIGIINPIIQWGQRRGMRFSYSPRMRPANVKMVGVQRALFHTRKNKNGKAKSLKFTSPTLVAMLASSSMR
eukprot:15289963-Ditylum_brightwellii.AAC.1